MEKKYYTLKGDATEKQLALLLKLGLYGVGLSKKEASDLIDEELRKRNSKKNNNTNSYKITPIKPVVKSYYDILMVSPIAEFSIIKTSYRKLAMKFHPDHNPDNKLAEEKFKEIANAYSVLSNIDKRKLYDKKLSGIK